AEVSPITQRNASTRLDLPQPFGPTMPVKPGAIASSVMSTKDLNPTRRNRSNCINFPGEVSSSSRRLGLGCEAGQYLLEFFPRRRASELVAVNKECRGRVNLKLLRCPQTSFDDLVFELGVLDACIELRLTHAAELG